MRTLATIQKIIDLQPILGADTIECATVLGWHVVVKKGEFKVGDYCVYFEVDSLLPQIPAFEFLAKGNTKKTMVNNVEKVGYRLKTIRLRGQISQGLAMPISILPQGTYPTDAADLTGTDVSEQLDIVKYEPPMPAELSGTAKGVLSGFVPKTDEIRIQTVPQILEKYQGIDFCVTEKIDGTSCTIFIKDGELNVCGRTINWLESSNNSYWKAAKALGIKEKLEKWAPSIALQGELIGYNIQGNKLKIQGQKILFFNAYDMKTKEYLGYVEFRALGHKLGIEIVPLIEAAYKLPKTVDEIVAHATRKSLINPEVWVEGIVVRPLNEMRDEDLGRLSFKVINPEFLLKYGK